MNWYLFAFLLIPVIFLGAKEAGRIQSPRWLIFAICVLSGWLLINLALNSYQAELDQLIASQPSPSDELVKEWEHDGAARVFALIFGWAYAAIYFFVVLGTVRLVAALYKKVRN